MRRSWLTCGISSRKIKIARSALRPRSWEGKRGGCEKGRGRGREKEKRAPQEPVGARGALFSTHVLLIHSPCTSHAWPQATPQDRRGDERGEERKREGEEERRRKGREGGEGGPRRRRGMCAAVGRSHWVSVGLERAQPSVAVRGVTTSSLLLHSATSAGAGATADVPEARCRTQPPLRVRVRGSCSTACSTLTGQWCCTGLDSNFVYLHTTCQAQYRSCE